MTRALPYALRNGFEAAAPNVEAFSAAAIIAEQYIAAVFAVEAERLLLSRLQSDALGVALLEVPNVGNMKMVRGQLDALPLPPRAASMPLVTLAATALDGLAAAATLSIASSLAATAATAADTAGGSRAILPRYLAAATGHANANRLLLTRDHIRARRRC